ncbi:hypothetical protein L5M38_20450 [Shewanella sp. SM101]|jgi:hypothetical protein|uniref:hypothetical protein n=1 Tax=Shewanella TaxID=22 RepID=UPI0002112D83|nr:MULTISPECIES: hypothetical protein [Shewanella]AEH16218.1 hypothetical protein Sbal117_4580 [Shewanella baltica OS117]MCU8008942.1 hypothetical protein [Shewanella sp. SM87]MCU8106893.1 hypothetical protein [Shewanella sp. SM101]
MNLNITMLVAFIVPFCCLAGTRGIEQTKSYTERQCSENKPASVDVLLSDLKEDDRIRFETYFPFGGIHREFGLVSNFNSSRMQVAEYFYVQKGKSKARYYEAIAKFDTKKGSGSVKLYCVDVTRLYEFPKLPAG